MKHMVVPDTQVKSGVPLDHLTWAGKYAVAKRPDVIVMIGDFADMESLSSYDKNKKSFEGRRYTKDIEAATIGMSMLLGPIKAEQRRLKEGKKKPWNPRLVLTLGNHEDRINRATNNSPELEGLISVKDLPYSDWEVIPYLQPITIDGVTYCHYFTSGVMGRPVSSARALTTKKHCSCVMGHVQRKEIDIQYSGEGRRITGIFAGAFYQHDEAYLGPQGNQHWRGIWMLHEVDKGSFDEMPVSLDYLRNRYEHS
ncbi:hypothetical protein UFOVP1590_55 [uncultured Caudovirales phage]|uniref:Calcineurin-like phosphoesterase domain, ApaH type n=1 Tax=uncultured Caudovirales phage TaxID=2100421 RepID=A0A6J5SPZ7_9CAUD|nr:hypothetical protein UFOVP1590_55 [uncultured Caudovirales phage]